MTLKYGKYEISYHAIKGNVQIVNSYKIQKRADMNAIVKLIRAEALKLGFKYKRSNSSWVTEWRAHNYMYDKRIDRARSTSVDLNDNESKLKLASFAVMSALYRKGESSKAPPRGVVLSKRSDKRWHLRSH